MKNVLLNNKYWHIALNVLVIYIIIMFFCSFSYNIDIKTNAPEGTFFEIRYKNSKSTIPILEEYDTMIDYVYTDMSGKIDLDVPIEVDQFTILTSEIQFLSISKLSISLFGIPIKTYNASQLLRHIEPEQNIIFDDIENNVIYFSNKTLIDLQVIDIFDGSMFIRLVCIVLFISLIITCFLYLLYQKLHFYSPIIVTSIIILVSPMFSYEIFEQMVNNFSYIKIEYRILNYSILLFIYLFILMIVNRPILSVSICNCFMLIIGIINYFVLQFRGKPILPWDIYAISTATSILDGYKFELTSFMWYSVAMICLFSFLLFKNKKCFIIPKRKKMIPVYILSIFIPILAFNSQTFSDIVCYYWDNDIVYLYKTKGSFASFFKYALDSRISEPENYNPDIVLELENEENLSMIKQNIIQPQNIIMIMNESFTDFQSLGCEYPEDVLEFYHSLASKSIYGNLFVSVRGGSTCNTEFEALTGNSLVFLPPGSFPFQTYVNDSIWSLPRYLKEKGFLCTGLHLEQGTNWNRNNVYLDLGFDIFLDINDFEELETVRNKATDEFNYKQIIEIIENSNSDKNFIFNTTIQNHGGYNEFYDLPHLIEISPDKNLENAEVYLSLVKLSDNALKKLIEYFDDIETPTMIIIFGDHQPKLNEESETYLLGNSVDNFERYITPFLIYRNYSSESFYIEKMSVNFLSSLILNIGNFELPTFNRFLFQLYENFPVITLQGIEDSEGKYYADIEEISNSDLFSIYESLQYYNMFDSH